MQKFRLFAVLSALVLSSSIAHSAVLNAVPMQGGMVMPMVSYNEQAGKIQVMMPTEVPQLTSLLISNPGDSFAPTDPWFDALDPSRRGDSFSRRYGFVMSEMSDLLPEGTQMWIRKISGPPEVKIYRYFGTDPKAFEPIFGTEGVTNALHWNGMMFHPVITAPPGTNDYSLAFEVFLKNADSGEELANSSSGPLEFKLTNIPDGRPALTVTRKIVVAWPADVSGNWVIESAPTPDASLWETVTNAPVMIDDQPSVVLDGAWQQYFRLRRQE